MEKTTIGRRLAYLRGGRTRAEVAEKIGISPSALAMYELGYRMPRDEIKVLLAGLYGITVQSLFYDEVNQPIFLSQGSR